MFFSEKVNAYVNSLPTGEAIKFLQGYADDAGSDGAWSKQHEIQSRIDAIRAADPTGADEYDAIVEAKRQAAAEASKAKAAQGFIARGLD
jgi:hypothetical protein